MPAASPASGSRQCRVAVVGGGPAGLAACRALAAAGHRPVVFEAGSTVGGIWAPQPINQVVYDSLVTNIPKVAMQSFDLDFPSELPSYVRAADLGRYFVAYAEHFSLERYVRFNCRVTAVQPLRSEQDEAMCQASWKVTWTLPSAGGGPIDQEEGFDAVVVANGHYEAPFVPEVPGQAAWLASTQHCNTKRTVRHSRDYTRPEEYSGRVVLVVGGRSSAVDIARELRQTARWVYVLDKGCTEAHVESPCAHLPLASRLRPDGFLEVGSEVVPGPAVEDIVLATGFLYSYPFLDADRLRLDFGPVARYVAPLYQHIVHARRPSLVFLGVPLAVPCPVPLFEAQARFVASWLASTSADMAGMEEWVQARRGHVGERTQDLHFLGGDTWAYMRELMQLAGIDGPDYDAYSQRLAMVQAIYEDRCSKKPMFPWSDDWYRRCEYTVDWPCGTWHVDLPKDAAA